MLLLSGLVHLSSPLMLLLAGLVLLGAPLVLLPSTALPRFSLVLALAGLVLGAPLLLLAGFTLKKMDSRYSTCELRWATILTWLPV